MSELDSEVVVEKKANSVVLYGTLTVTSLLLIYAIYLSGSLVSKFDGLSLPMAMWEISTGGGMMVHAVSILVLFSIGLIHFLNKLAGEKSMLIEKIAGILLKLPINIILLLIALFLAFMGYGKFSVGINAENLNGGGYILDWVTVAMLLFLVFFVKKV